MLKNFTCNTIALNNEGFFINALHIILDPTGPSPNAHILVVIYFNNK